MAITPKSEDKYVEKCSTAQSFIRTEMSTYRIGTLPYWCHSIAHANNNHPIKVAKIKLQFGSKIKMTKFVTDFSPRSLKFHNRTDANWEQENTVNWYQYFCFSRSVQICMEVTWSLTTPMMKQKVRYILLSYNFLTKLCTYYFGI